MQAWGRYYHFASFNKLNFPRKIILNFFALSLSFSALSFFLCSQLEFMGLRVFFRGLFVLVAALKN